MAEQSTSTGRASLDSVAFVEHELRRRRRRRSDSSRSSISSSSSLSLSAESFDSSQSQSGPVSPSTGSGGAEAGAEGSSGSASAPWPDVPPPPEPEATPGTNYRQGAGQDPPPSRPDSTEDFICRICFDGPGGDGDGERLGRLIAPCRCKGTMKFVHTTCLSRWRVLSRRSTSSMACDQCGAAYRFKRSPFVGLATSPTLLFLVSIVLFTLLIWTVGFAAELAIQRWGGAQELVGTTVAPGGGTQAVRAVLQGVGTSSSSIYDDEDDDEDLVHARGGYYYSTGFGLGYGTYVPFYAEPLGYASLVKAAVREIAGGGALAKTWRFLGTALKRGEGDDDDEDGPDEGSSARAVHPRDRGSWWDSLKWEWKYGKGGVWEGQDPELSSQAKSEGSAATGAATSGSEGGLKEPASGSEGDASAASTPTLREPEGEASQMNSHPEAPTRLEEDDEAFDAFGSSSWLDRLALQFSLGFSLIGILSFLNMLASMAFLGPLHFGNLGLGRGFARLTGGAGGGRRRGGGGGGGVGDSGGATIASVLIVALVLIGVLRALHAVYKLVGKLAKRMLARLEEAIVDRYGEADEAEDVDDAPGGGAARNWSLAGLNRWLPWLSREQARPVERGAAAAQQAEERNRWMAARAGD